MSEPQRLSKRVAQLIGCSRREAEYCIEGGWVTVNGEVVELAQTKVADALVEVHPEAIRTAPAPATILLHRPVAAAAPEAAGQIPDPVARWEADDSGLRSLRRHFVHLETPLPLEAEASGLQVFSQDARVCRLLREEADSLEQEFVVEVSGDIAPDGLQRLAHGLRYGGRVLPPGKVSWQNEFRLRFAIKAVLPGQLRATCAEVGLQVVAIRRLRIGRVSLGKMPPGQWRYLPAAMRF